MIIRKLFLFIFFQCFFALVYGQDVRVVDDFKNRLNSLEGTARLNAMVEIAFNETHPDSIIWYASLLNKESEDARNWRLASVGLIYQGDGYRLKGNYDLAFDAYFRALKLIDTHKLKENDVTCHIADTYSVIGDEENATQFYKKCIQKHSKSTSPLDYATALFNLGDHYLKFEKIDSANFYNTKASQLFETENYVTGLIYTSGNKGLIEAEKGHYIKAEKSLNYSIEKLEELQIYDAVAEYMLGMADVLFKKREYLLAMEYATLALEEGHKGDFRELIKNASLKLSNIYEELNKTGEAFGYLKQYLGYRDSLKNTSVVARMANIRNAYELEQKAQKERSVKYTEVEFIEDKPRYYAVLFGVNDYTYDDDIIADLNEPIENTESLYNCLTTKYQFDAEHTMLIPNPKRADIINTLEMLSKSIRERDNLLVFFAGHGTYDEKLSIGYWLPSDARSDSKVNWVSNSVIRDYIAGLSSRHTLLISDACFSGSIFKTRGIKENDMDEFGFSRLYRMNSRKAMTSGNLDTVPDVSLFMEFMIKRLLANDQQFISARQLFAELETAVLNNTGNIPQYGTIQNTGDEGGEFIFIKQ